MIYMLTRKMFQFKILQKIDLQILKQNKKRLSKLFL